MGGKGRKIVLISLLAWSVGVIRANADLLRFTSAVREMRGVTVGEVIARGQVIVRFRTATGVAVGSRAQIVALRLHQQALQGITGDEISVATMGSSVQVKVGNNLLVAPDRETARLCGISVPGLAAQWTERIAAAFTPPYLTVDLGRPLRVPVGESRTVRYGGRFPEVITAESVSPDIVAVSVDKANKILILEGKGSGDTQVKVTAGGVAGEFAVICRPWAGQVKAFAQAEITGHNISAQTRRQAAVNAILSGLTVAPGATASLPQLTGNGRLWKGLVVLEGAGYFRREQEVIVHHKLIPAPEAQPSQVLVSNKPEKVTAPAVLLRESVPADQSRRVLWHHVNLSEGRLSFVLRLINDNNAPLRVHLLGDSAGPGRSEMYLGHIAMQRFWQALEDSAGYVVAIPAGMVWNTYQQPTGPSQLVSGVAQLTNLGTAPLLVEVAAEARPTGLPLTRLEARTDASWPLSGCEYVAERQVSVAHTIGGPWSFVHIGKHTEADQLPGDYGVMYNIDVEVHNPFDATRPFEIRVIAAGGAARGLFRIRGQMVATRVLRPNQETLLYQRRVPAQATVSVPIKTIPQAGSNYPVTLVVASRRQ